MDENIRSLAEAILALTDQERQELIDLLRSPKPVTQLSVEAQVRNWLAVAGAPVAPKGFRYIPTAVALMLELPDGDMMTKVLYPAVAKLHGTTGTRVERAIRSEIERLYKYGNPDALPVYIRADLGKPTNSEFITALALGFKKP